MILTWTEGLHMQGIDVTTVILRHPGSLREAVGDLPFVFLRLHEFGPRTLFDLVSPARRHDVDVLHVQGTVRAPSGRLAAMILRRTLIVHVHADYRLGVKGYPPYVRILGEFGISLDAPVVVTVRQLPDDPDQLARSILKLLADDARCAAMSLHALAAAKRFDLTKAVKRFERIYRSVLRWRPSDAALPLPPDAERPTTR